MRSFSEYLADTMRMPKDVLMDLPKISICGDKEIFIENHKGLIEYSDTVVRMKMNDGIVCVHGTDMRIVVMQYDRMVINGNFAGVTYEKS